VHLVLWNPEHLCGRGSLDSNLLDVVTEVEAALIDYLQEDVGALAAGRGTTGLVCIHAPIG